MSLRQGLIACMVLLFTMGIGGSAPARPRARLDPVLRMMLNTPPARRQAFAHKFKLAPSEEVGVILEYEGDPDDLRALGARIKSQINNICTADIPLSRLSEIEGLPALKYIQAATLCEPVLDVSVPETGASALRSGTPPAWTGYTGKGVIIGAVDTGIDVAHSDFKNAAGLSRILYVWDQNTGTGGANHPAGYDYGTEWTTAQIDAGQCTERDPAGHGTVVMSVAAGDGSATGYGWPAYRYVGMAPEADIISVKTTMYTDDIVDGINYIKSKANALGKPFVINLSLGSQYGAHDGTDLMERSIDQISGQGAVVCVAAGNSRTGDPAKYIHANWTLPSAGSSVTANMTVLSNRSNPFFIQIWYQGQDFITMTVRTPNGYSVTKATRYTTGGYYSTPDGNIWLENALAVDSYNGDNRCTIVVENALAGAWQVTATAQSITQGGRCDGWMASSNVYWGTYGNNSMSLIIPGTSSSAITVGGYWTKNQWVNPDGTVQGGPVTFGAFFGSSGEGPTRDNRQKPDLTASASAAGARSVDYSYLPDLVEDGVHMMARGTSYSSPHAAGAAALLLQKDPTATAAEIRDSLISTAVADSFTGAVPNYMWGYGKLSVSNAFPLLPLYTNVAGARAQPDNALVKLAGQVVSAGYTQMGSDRFYVEDSSRAGGIQVRIASGAQPNEKDVVTVRGAMGNYQGERAILNSDVTRTGVQTGTVPEPLCMINRSIGGATTGYVPGVVNGIGLNNIGLLVKEVGRITYIGADYFYIDDGSNVPGAGGQVGIKVYCPGLTKPNPTKTHAVVTGICTIEMDGSAPRPRLRPRKQTDLLYY